jgi:hypothetical protein
MRKLLILLLATMVTHGAERPPNIVLILADDRGITGLGTPLPPHSAIRVGDHKLIWNWLGRLELYDIPKDPGESHDLSQEMPEVIAQLHKQLKQWLKENVAPRYMPQRDESVSPESAGGSFPFRDLR